MFVALNSKPDENERKSEREERKELVTLYNRALETLEVDSFISHRLKHETNRCVYNKGREYLLFNYSLRKELKEVEENIEKHRLTEYKYALFCLVKRNIENANFIRAKKLLNLARDRNYHTNALYELEKLLRRQWYPKV
jgi:hypothetical protein